MANIAGFLCKLIGIDANTGAQVYHHHRHKDARRHPMAKESFKRPDGTVTDVIYANPTEEKKERGLKLW